MSSEPFKIEWLDRRAEPQCKPNPAYPKGIDVDLTHGARPACDVSLPYPAKRIGFYRVECRACGMRVMLTTAGRPDDPRSVKIACKRQGGSA